MSKKVLRNIKKIATVGIATTMVISSSVFAFASSDSGSGSAGSTDYWYSLNLDNTVASAYLDAGAVCDLSIDGYASTVYRKYALLAGDGQGTSIGSRRTTIDMFHYAEATYSISSEDGGATEKLTAEN